MLVTALGGLALLLLLAIVVGYLDGHAQGQAWRRIATERHRLWLDKQHTVERQREDPQHECHCPNCPSR